MVRICQADIYTHDIRSFLQIKWDSLPGERAWVFPFNLAHSNNPGNYRFTSDNEWTGYRSAKNKAPDIPYKYGLLGYVITTADSIVNMHFDYKRTIVKPPVKQIKILHNKGDFNYDINLRKYDSNVKRLEHNRNLEPPMYILMNLLKHLIYNFIKKTAEKNQFGNLRIFIDQRPTRYFVFGYRSKRCRTIHLSCRRKL